MEDFDYEAKFAEKSYLRDSKVAGLHTIDQVVLQDDVILRIQHNSAQLDFKHLDLLIEIAQVIQTHLAERVLKNPVIKVHWNQDPRSPCKS